MTDEMIEEAKAQLRSRAHALRAALAQDEREEASRAAAEHFFSGVVLDPGAVVAAYWPIRDEVDCQPILIRLMDSLQPVCLPVVLGDSEPLQLRLWEQGTPLYPAGYGTLAPDEQSPLVEPDVILMPLLAIDRRGTRLGYGGGYYDRTLAQMGKQARLVGLAFAAQEIDEIPREVHDIPLDAVVTENGVVTFGPAETAR
jgi:5-formyltetrahydrofolate cyclo-ligase